MDTKVIIQKIFEFISDFFRTKTVRYLLTFLIVSLVIAFLFGNKKVDVQKELLTEKHNNEKLFERSTKIGWKEFNEVYMKLDSKVRQIVDEGKAVTEEEIKLEKLLLIKGSEYTINCQDISKNDYNVYSFKMVVGVMKESEGGDGSLELYGTIDMKVKYENGEIVIVDVSNFSK